MAIAFVKDFTGSDAFASSFAATVPAGGIAAGNHLVISAGCADASFTVSSVTDSSSNTYTVHDSQVLGGFTLVFISGYIGTALSASDTVTFTLGGATGGAAILSEFSGLASSSYLDQTAKATIAFDTPYSSGLTATTTQADELVFGHQITGDTSVVFTPSGTYTKGEEDVFFSAWNQQTQYKIVSATGTYESDGTASTAAAIISMVATLKAAAGGTNATVDMTGVLAASTASVVAPPKPRPTAPFSEINLRM